MGEVRQGPQPRFLRIQVGLGLLTRGAQHARDLRPQFVHRRLGAGQRIPTEWGRRIEQGLHRREVIRRQLSKVGFLTVIEGNHAVVGLALLPMHKAFDRRQQVILGF